MLSEQQQRILGYFIEEAKDHLNTIEQGLLNLQSTISDTEMVSEVFRAAHSVKGGAAMLGLDCIQHTAHKLEDYFKVLKECPIQVDQKLETLLLRVFDTLQELLEQLQGPFGLTDDKASEVMAATEPVFAALQEHLSLLVEQAGSRAPEDVVLQPPVAVPAARPAEVNAEESALQLIFRSDVPAHLREMLNLFKQVDTLTSRQRLQEICQTLSRAGEQFDLPRWSSLLELAQQAIACPDNAYRTLAPIIIRNIKQAQELVLVGRSPEICASDDLTVLVPVTLAAPPTEEAIDDLIGAAAFDADTFDLDLVDLAAEPAEISAEDSAIDSFSIDQLFAAEAESAEEQVIELGDELDWAEALGQISELPTDQDGPEVGSAELNSLADLFEGEIPDLYMTWQEEVLDDRSGTLSESLDLDANNDYSDLLFDQDSATAPSLDEDDLSGFLRQNELSEPVDASQSSAADALDQLLEADFLAIDMTIEPSAVDEAEFAQFFTTETAPPSSASDEAAAWDANDLNTLLGSLEPDLAVDSAADAADLDDLSDLGALLNEFEAADTPSEAVNPFSLDVANLDAADIDAESIDAESIDAESDVDDLFDWQALEQPQPLAAAAADAVAEEAAPLDGDRLNDFADQVELWGMDPDAPAESSAADERAWVDADVTGDLWDSEETPADVSGLSLDQIPESALFDAIDPDQPDSLSAELPEALSWDEPAAEEITEEPTTAIQADELMLADIHLFGAETEPEPSALASEPALEVSLDDLFNEEAEADASGPDAGAEALAFDFDLLLDDVNTADRGLDLDFLLDPDADAEDAAADGDLDELLILDFDGLISESGEDMAIVDESADEAAAESMTDSFADGLAPNSSSDSISLTEEPSFERFEAWNTNSLFEEEPPANAAAMDLDDMDLLSLVLEETTDADPSTSPSSGEVSAEPFDDLFSVEAAAEEAFDALFSDAEHAEVTNADAGESLSNFDALWGEAIAADAELALPIDDAENSADDRADDLTSLDALLEDAMPSEAELLTDDAAMAEDVTAADSELDALLEAVSTDSAADLPADPGLEALDLDALLETVPPARSDDLADLDSLLNDVEAIAAAEEAEAIASGTDELTAAGFGAPLSDADPFDDLLGDMQPLRAESDDFADLEAMLDEDATFSISGFSSDFSSGFNEDREDDFADLEALLSDEATPVISRSSEFDDLEKLLETTDKTLSTPARTNRRTSLTPKKRSPSNLNDQTMRVSVKNLDNLNNLVGELVVNRNSLEQAQERLRQFLDNLVYQVQQLSDVGQRMRDLYERSLLESSLLSSRRSYQLSSQGASSSVSANHSTGMSFDALEMDRFTGFHTLSQEMIELIVRVRESASDIDYVVVESDQVTRMFRQVTTQLQEGLTRSRMVPFDQIAARLPRAVRDISVKYGKQAELAIEGKETLIDKMILEQLYDPMTHLVNNALTHGIETPEERRAAGKPPAGRITVRAFHQGNQTVISVTDDGAGIDPEKVKRKAVEKGLITPTEAREMTRLDVYDLLFHHGFSTKDKADDFAGRGVGMDVVRTSLNEIRGSINIDSTVGKGTTFTIRLPLTLSISKALCCISNRARVAFPMDGVEDMLNVPKDQIQTDSEGRPCIQWRDALLPFQELSDLLKYNRSLGRGSVYGGNQEEDIIPVIVLRSNAGSYLALQVDQVLGEQEIVIKQLEGPAPKPVGVAGATVLGDGRIMPIADVLELIDLSMGRIRREPGSSLWEKSDEQPPAEPPVVKTDPTVLIVDDSITVRELLSMTFNKVGYRVEQARDGQEAWEKLRSGLPCDLVFCDIEMPRMDGLELLSRIQKDPNLSHLPIAMLTSRGADRHRQMAVQLGAKGYFTKPYLEEALLDAAQRMLRGEVLVG